MAKKSIEKQEFERLLDAGHCGWSWQLQKGPKGGRFYQCRACAVYLSSQHGLGMRTNRGQQRASV